MRHSDLKELLEEKSERYNSPEFIDTDPIQIPHLFSKKEDIEISGFLAATIAWGQRPTIIKNAMRIVEGMDHAPYDFIMNHEDTDLQRFEKFVHRTFNYSDLIFFITSLKNIYKNHAGLEACFATSPEDQNMKNAIKNFRETFFATEHMERSKKHVSDPFRNSACKRINMYLRWMVRPENTGVDFGSWKSVSPALLSCPLDVHTGNVARKLGLLTRKQNDWKAVEELDTSLRKFDPEDPVKYDFALFGMGVFEGIK